MDILIFILKVLGFVVIFALSYLTSTEMLASGRRRQDVSPASSDISAEGRVPTAAASHAARRA